MKKSVYYYQQRSRQESILNKTNIFEGASGNGVYWDNKKNRGAKNIHIFSSILIV